MQEHQGNKGLYEQEKFREMPTKELRDCIQQDNDAGRAQRAQKVLSERGDTGTTKKFEEGNVKQGGGQRGMKEEGGQSGFGDERTRGDQRDVKNIERDY